MGRWESGEGRHPLGANLWSSSSRTNNAEEGAWGQEPGRPKVNFNLVKS